MHKKKVLIIDDENTLSHSLSRVLHHYGYLTKTVSSKKEFYQLFEHAHLHSSPCAEENPTYTKDATDPFEGTPGKPLQGHQCTDLHLALGIGAGFDIVLLDLKLPDGDGLDLMKHIKELKKDTQVIVMTGYGTIDLAVEATKKGAFHFITKPFNMGEIINLCSRALSQSKLETENARLRSFVKKQYHFDQIIGQSRSILDLLEMIKKVANSSSTVLITGESGTGKELVAKSIHLHSEQHQGTFYSCSLWSHSKRAAGE